MDVIWEIKEFIENLCKTKNMSIDLRFACLGDVNKFYTNNDEFSVDCVGYYAKDIEDIKQLFTEYLDIMWDEKRYPYNRTALYIKDIIDMNDWYEVIIGGALFNDDSLCMPL